MQVDGRPQPVEVGGEHGLMTTLKSQSPFQGETESDTVVTVARPQGLFYLVFIAPRSEAGATQGILRAIVRSVQFR